MKLVSTRKQAGAALIIALMITVIATSLASVAMYRQQIQIRLTDNISSLEQAYQYADSMEDFAKKVLKDDYKDNPNVDSAHDEWRKHKVNSTVEGAQLKGQLFDLQGFFNLNSLGIAYTDLNNKSKTGENKNKDVDKDKEANKNEKPKTKDLVYKWLTALIAAIDIEQTLGPPENFVDTLQDWIDKDDDENEKKYSAESSYYQSLPKPYMSANTPLMDVSELLLLKGVTIELFKRIKPLVSTLPIETIPKINVNMVPKEVLKALGFTDEATKAIIERRNENPIKSLAEFWNIPEVNALFAPKTEKGRQKPNYNKQVLTVRSDYFLLEGSVIINNTRLFVNSILYRNKDNKGKVDVIRRNYSNSKIYKREYTNVNIQNKHTK